MLVDRDNKATSTHQVQKQKTPLHCSYCDRDYHSIEKCYYLHGFPIGHKLHVKNVKPPNQCHSNAKNMKVETNKVVEIKTKFIPTSDGPRLTTEEYNQLMAMIQKNNGGNSQNFANATGINMPSSKIILDRPHLNMCWIINSGTTDHVTSSTELLDPKNLPRTPTISFPDGDQAHIESIGSLHITPHIKLNDVLKVPQFQVNLLSVSKLTQTLQCIVMFFFYFCVVQDTTTRKTIGLG